MTEIKKSLLPQGFHDHLPPEAAAEMALNSVVVNQLTLFGYELVRPALMEFEESLDKDFTSDFFKVTDTISGKMMVIRNDITPQIARIVKDRFGEKALSETVRLAYTGQVIRKTGKGKFTERQLTQTGFELVSENSAKRDAEVLYVAIETYEKAGIKDFTVDLCYPKLSGLLLKEKGSSAKESAEIIKKIEEKDIQALSQDSKNADIVKIIETLDEASDIKTGVAALEELEKEISSSEVVKIFTRIKEVLQILSKSVSSVKLSLNLLEIHGFEYHNGLCYSVISRKNFDEIGRGGRYKISINKENSVSASGFTFLINAMTRSIETNVKTEQKKVKYDEGFASSKNLRDKNIITIFE
jgi:ATP phosphoribosyltransferase regulatory subunit